MGNMKSQLEKMEGNNKRRRTEGEDRQGVRPLEATVPKASHGSLSFNLAPPGSASNQQPVAQNVLSTTASSSATPGPCDLRPSCDAQGPAAQTDPTTSGMANVEAVPPEEQSLAMDDYNVGLGEAAGLGGDIAVVQHMNAEQDDSTSPVAAPEVAPEAAPEVQSVLPEVIDLSAEEEDGLDDNGVCCICGASIRAPGTVPHKEDGYTCWHNPAPARCCGPCTWTHVSASLEQRGPIAPAVSSGSGIQCPAPSCSGSLLESELSAVAPVEYSAWASRASEALIQSLECIRCPNPDCGASIERLPATDMPHGLEPTGCPEIDRTAPRAEAGPGGVPMTRGAALHKWRHRYRCAICRGDFCDLCSARPYHEGLTCEEFAAPRCSLCREAPVTADASSVKDMPTKELRQTLLALGSPDTSWCIERNDYEDVYRRAASVCASTDCRTHLTAACTRTSPCGLHPCAGIRGEQSCLGCLRCPAAASAEPQGDGGSRPSSSKPLPLPKENVFDKGTLVTYIKGGTRELAMVIKVDRSLSPPAYTIQLESGAERDTEAERLELIDDSGEDGGGGAASGYRPGSSGDSREQDTCAMCSELLLSAPVIRLEHCGHLYHLHCCKQRIESGYPGPNISFGYLSCPLCRLESSTAAGNCQVSSRPMHLEHWALVSYLQEHMELRSQVMAQAKARVRAMGPKRIPELQPGGSWDGRPVDYAMEHFLFYKCSRCSRPYFGGARECGAAPEEAREGGWNPEEMLCSRCGSGDSGSCPTHGTDFIEWKCRFCCSIASWCCFGGTHMCNPCHDKYLTQGGWGSSWQPPNCRGPKECPLGVQHPPNGREHCLGCALCREAAL